MFWEDGELTVENVRYDYHVRMLKVASGNGIDGGKINKLNVLRDGVSIARYDYGWEVYPDDAPDLSALEEVLREFN